jgi:hypothetical protein
MRSSQVSLKTTVIELFGLRTNPHKNRIGLEIEVEGTGIPAPDWSSRYWKIVPEGSLRNGHEFVTGAQCTINNLPTYLEDLKAGLKGAKLDLSIRTSTHLHVNVANFTIEEVYAVISAFYLVEDTLVRSQGKPRMGNLFCLRSKDAEGIFDILINQISSGIHLQIEPNLRYGALNLNALSKFGSVEFRFMKAMTDTDLLRLWTENLHGLVHRAKELGSVREVLFQYKRAKNLRDFYALFFTDEMLKLLHPYMTDAQEVLPYILLLQKSLKRLDKPAKVKYNFKFTEDLDVDAVREFDVPVRDESTLPKLNIKSKNDLINELNSLQTQVVMAAPPPQMPALIPFPSSWFDTANPND